MQRERAEISSRGIGHLMTPTVRSAGNTRVFMFLHNQLFKVLAAHGRGKISGWFRESVSELIGKEDLQLELRRFYRRHSAFFSKELGSTAKQIELRAPSGTYEFLQSLSFSIFGNGNVSLVSRVLMYHFAVKQKWIPAPPIGVITKEAAGRPITGASKMMPVAAMPDKRSDRRRAALCVDCLFTGYETTQRDLDSIARITRRGKAAALRYLIEQAAADDTPEKIRDFFKRKWRRRDRLQQGIVRIRYRLSRRLDATLDRLVYQILEDNNRSLTLRTIIAYFVIQYRERTS